MNRCIPLMLALILVSCCASMPAATSSSAQTEITYPAGHSLNADFDGDDKPDVAIGRPNEQAFTVEIRFTTHVPNAFLTMPPGHPGLQILAYDVDRDNFPDLVVTSPVSLLPVAVWLGDGRGHFRQGDPWAYLPFHWDTPFRYKPGSRHDSGAGGLQEKRLSIQGLLDLRAERNLETGKRISRQVSREYSPLFIQDLSARSPPRSTPL